MCKQWETPEQCCEKANADLSINTDDTKTRDVATAVSWTRGIQALAQPLPHRRTHFISLHSLLNHHFFRHTFWAFPLGEENTDTRRRKHSEGCRGYNVTKRIYKRKSRTDNVMETGAKRVRFTMRSSLDKGDTFNLTPVVWRGEIKLSQEKALGDLTEAFLYLKGGL